MAKSKSKTADEAPKHEPVVQNVIDNPGVEQTLFLLRHKRGVAGVQLSMVRARDVRTAEEVGKRYCDSNMGFRFIRIEPAVVADESILIPKTTEEEAEEVA